MPIKDTAFMGELILVKQEFIRKFEGDRRASLPGGWLRPSGRPTAAFAS